MNKTSLNLLLLLLPPLAFYYIQRWQEEDYASLREVKKLVKNYNQYRDLKEIAIKFKNDIKKAAKEKIYKDIEDKINEDFLPERVQDYILHQDIEIKINDNIQKDITTSLKTVMKEEIKKITKDVISKKTLRNDIKNYPENLCDKNKKLPPNQKIITYTVFGTRKLYYQGIPKVLDEISASNFYHNWRVRIYHDALITPEVIAQYKSFKNLDFCDARRLPRYGNITGILGKFWRNIPMGDESVDISCSRDLDSAILTREEDAVRDFLKSGKFMHLMRDHPEHMATILAGMWCINIGANRPLARKLLEQLLEEGKTWTRKTDQPLLHKVFFIALKAERDKYMMQHDSYLCKHYEGSIPFPSQRRDNTEYIGCPSHHCRTLKFKKCPAECRPKNHQDWEFC